MNETKSIKSRVFKLAHKLRKDALRDWKIMTMSEALVLSWKVIKAWKGGFNERVSIAYEVKGTNGGGHPTIEKRILEIVIRNT